MSSNSSEKNQILEVLLFKHPTAGIQLVKGTIERSERIFQAAIRELYEESGIVVEEQHCYDWGSHQISNQTWYFIFCDTSSQNLKDQWSYETLDDYGIVLSFSGKILMHITFQIYLPNMYKLWI